MRRRTLVKAGSAALLVPGVLGCQQAAAPAAQTANRLEAFGLQLSTVTPLLLADFEGTLNKVAAIGYPQVEFSAMGFLGRSTEQIKALLAETGLEAPVGRVSPRLPDDFFALPREQAMQVYMARSAPEHFLTNVAHSLESAVALGQSSLVLPALGPDQFASREQIENNIGLLNRAGELCSERGVMFGYHNHNWELAAVDGVVPYELMLEQTDPTRVTFQLDAYWLVKAGADLSDYLRRYAGRFSSCHLKDIDADGDFADIGFGEIDFPRFAREALAQGARHFFVERDNPPEPEASIRRSFAYVKSMTF